jgi:argininosuccinate lyase
VASLIVDAAEPNRERMLDLARKNYSTATDLADALVRDAGLSFRDAHHVVGRVVRLAMEEGRSADLIDSALIAQAGKDVLGRPVEIDAALVRDAVDPSRAVESRRNTGGPSRHDIAQMLARTEARLAADREEIAARRERIAMATRRLNAEVAACMGGGRP